MTDALIMFLAGLAFSWERALYSIVMLYISGIAAETVTQGSRVVRTAMIITGAAETVSEGILHGMGRGLTRLAGKGAFTGVERAVLYCVISRAEVERLKALVAEADPRAFVVIGHAYEALGEGFQEIGAGQGESVLDMAKAALPNSEVEVRLDLAERDRLVVVDRKSEQ